MSSQSLHETAVRYIPGGVNSPVRAFGSVGGTPIYVERGLGPRFQDADGRWYIDYCLSWGPLILGHAPPAVLDAVKCAVERGTSYGAPTGLEVEMARTVVEALPSMEMVRMVNSGTEATMSAIRVARAATGRSRVLKFNGCYHGHADPFLSKAGSGMATLGIPASPGVTPGCAQDTLSCDYNDLEAAAGIFRNQGAEIAAVIVEPVAGNMGVVPPRPGFLQGLEGLCRQYGSLLVFDEVITGFRVGYSGAQGLYGIRPDLTCLGKIIGGGFPVGAYGGRRELMELVAPRGPVYQAGTLAGNPIALTAGLVTLRELAGEGVYEALEERSRRLVEGLVRIAGEESVPVTAHRVGSLFSLFFQEGPVTGWNDVERSDAAFYRRYFHAMADGGVYLAPSPFEAGFLSTVHGDAEIESTLEAHRNALRRASRSGQET